MILKKPHIDEGFSDSIRKQKRNGELENLQSMQCYKIEGNKRMTWNLIYTTISQEFEKGNSETDGEFESSSFKREHKINNVPFDEIPLHINGSNDNFREKRKTEPLIESIFGQGKEDNVLEENIELESDFLQRGNKVKTAPSEISEQMGNENCVIDSFGYDELKNDNFENNKLRNKANTKPLDKTISDNFRKILGGSFTKKVTTKLKSEETPKDGNMEVENANREKTAVIVATESDKQINVSLNICLKNNNEVQKMNPEISLAAGNININAKSCLVHFAQVQHESTDSSKALEYKTENSEKTEIYKQVKDNLQDKSLVQTLGKKICDNFRQILKGNMQRKQKIRKDCGKMKPESTVIKTWRGNYESLSLGTIRRNEINKTKFIDKQVKATRKNEVSILGKATNNNFRKNLAENLQKKRGKRIGCLKVLRKNGFIKTKAGTNKIDNVLQKETGMVSSKINAVINVNFKKCVASDGIIQEIENKTNDSEVRSGKDFVSGIFESICDSENALQEKEEIEENKNIYPTIISSCENAATILIATEGHQSVPQPEEHIEKQTENNLGIDSYVTDKLGSARRNDDIHVSDAFQEKNETAIDIESQALVNKIGNNLNTIFINSLQKSNDESKTTSDDDKEIDEESDSSGHSELNSEYETSDSEENGDVYISYETQPMDKTIEHNCKEPGKCYNKETGRSDFQKRKICLHFTRKKETNKLIRRKRSAKERSELARKRDRDRKSTTRRNQTMEQREMERLKGRLRKRRLRMKKRQQEIFDERLKRQVASWRTNCSVEENMLEFIRKYTRRKEKEDSD